MPVDWSRVRKEFPVLADWVYLNAATFGPVPKRAVFAAQRQLERRNLGPCLDFLNWYDEADLVRASAAGLIGAQAADIGFIPSAGIGLSWILNGIDWRPGDRIVGLEDEFPNNIYGPLMLERQGVEFVAAPGGDEFSIDHLLSAIDDRTRLVLLSLLNYSTGLKPPIAEIAAAAKKKGGMVCLDATQGMGSIEVNVDSLGVDLLLCHCYKSMLSPAGAGILYVSRQAREHVRPTVFSWRSHRDWRNVDHLHHGAPALPDETAAYEGGVLNYAGIAAMGAVFDWLRELGPSQVYARVAELIEQTKYALRAAGGELIADQKPYFDSSIVTAKFPGKDASALSRALLERKVAVAARKGRLRVSPHFYNNEQDIERLQAALSEVV